MKTFLQLMGALALLGVFGVCVEACRWLQTLNRVTAEVPAQVDNRLASIQGMLDTRLASVEGTLDNRLASIQGTANTRLASIQGTADARLASIQGTVDNRLGEVTAIRADIRPVLTEAAGTLRDVRGAVHDVRGAVQDVRDTMDDMYPEVKTLVSTADVAARSVSETAGAVERAAPQLADAGVRQAQNIAGITEDVHTLTNRLTKPKTFWGRAWEAVKVAAGAARFF